MYLIPLLICFTMGMGTLNTCSSDKSVSYKSITDSSGNYHTFEKKNSLRGSDGSICTVSVRGILVESCHDSQMNMPGNVSTPKDA